MYINKQNKWKKHRKYEPVSIGVVAYSYELLCEHGIGHDNGIHGCDGCCSDPSFKEEFKKLKNKS